MQNYIEVLPRQTPRMSADKLFNQARIGFYKDKYGHTLVKLSVGLYWLKKIGIDPETDKVVIRIDPNNPLIWNIARHPDGWKFYPPQASKSPKYYYLRISWRSDIPETLRDSTSKFVPYVDIYDGGLRLGLPGIDRNDLIMAI